MEYVLMVLAGTAVAFLLKGAWLMVQDSELKHQVRKELRQANPDISREELKELTRKKLHEMALNDQRY